MLMDTSDTPKDAMNSSIIDHFDTKAMVVDGVPAERIPKRHQELFRRVSENRVGRKEAIKAKCLHCVGLEDGIRRIRNCTIIICPLWNFRPYQSKKLATDLVDTAD